MAWCNLKSCEAQVVQVIEEPSNSSLGLNLTQVPRLEEEGNGRRVHPQVKFEHIIQPWHHWLGIDLHSLLLVLEVKPIVDDEPEITYESIFEGDEVAMLV